MLNRSHFVRRSLFKILFITLLASLSQLAYGTPKLFYTDIVTGPNTGGENNLGAYLTLFGTGFGATQGTSQVTINNVPVAAVVQWTDTKVTVQPGPRVTSGVIGITVGSNSYSHPTITFTVVPGKVFFVSLTGSDTSGQEGNISRPFRRINTVFDSSRFGPGDHIVVRGGTWSDVYALYGSFFSIHHKGGTAAAPIVIMGYPTETVLLKRTTQTAGINSYATAGHYVIANFHLNADGRGLGIGIAPGTNVRVVNNEVYGYFEDSGGSAAIVGSGKQFRILGNHVHDNGGSKLYHAMYFDGRDTAEGGPNDIEIAYNHIHHQTGGRGIQVYGDSGTLINNVRVHHNLIHDIALDGIIFGRDSGTGFLAYNNVIYRTADPSLRGPTTDFGVSGGCIRFDSPHLVAAVYNNTFADCAIDGDPDSGGIRFQKAKQATLTNNIVSGKYYVNVSSMPETFASSHNLWFGKGSAPTWDTQSISADPRFVNPSAGDFRLRASSPAIDRGSSNVKDVVTNDFDGVPRPQGGGYDVGAFEFIRSTPSQHKEAAPTTQ